MRKAQKKQIEDFVELLEEAHGEICREIENQNPDSALRLLEQCQEGAVSVGKLIEDSEGEQAEAVPLLENYCEQLYLIYEDISHDRQIKGNKVHKILKKSFIQIRNSISRIKVRIEAVFLPYKASMWDTFESVWKEAEADPDCDAYVIPIPYFDKNPDGSFKEAFYEGNLYPDYVPITRYDAYDFEAHRPDMILIHNPYDDSNYVTSVHPFFYSSNLKNFTDNLVYIPYFISKEVHPDNLTEIKNGTLLHGVRRFECGYGHCPVAGDERSLCKSADGTCRRRNEEILGKKNRGFGFSEDRKSTEYQKGRNRYSG